MRAPPSLPPPAPQRRQLQPGRGGVEVTDEGIRWWTFAGGRINATLRYALDAAGRDWKIVPDNFLIRVRGNGLNRHTFGEVLQQLSDPLFWENKELWATIAASLPSYRLSKFQPLLPPWLQREIVASYLLDIPGARRWLAR